MTVSSNHSIAQLNIPMQMVSQWLISCVGKPLDICSSSQQHETMN